MHSNDIDSGKETSIVSKYNEYINHRIQNITIFIISYFFTSPFISTNIILIFISIKFKPNNNGPGIIYIIKASMQIHYQGN